MDQFGQALFPDAGLNMGPGMLVMNISPILKYEIKLDIMGTVTFSMGPASFKNIRMKGILK